MPSFDIMCAPNAVELKNAVDTANKEIANRFDFKGSNARLELKDIHKERGAAAIDPEDAKAEGLGERFGLEQNDGFHRLLLSA